MITTIIIIFFALIFFPGIISAQANPTIGFQGKVVNRSDGTNVVPGSPTCVSSGDSNDTCDFRFSIYSEQSGGNLLWQEIHSNLEISTTGGVLSLKLNSICNSWASPVSPCAGSGIIWGDDPTLFLQVEWDTDGNGDFVSAETFTRKELTSVPFAYYAGSATSIAGGLDTVYSNDPDKILNINDLLGLEFISESAGNIVFDMQSTGDVIFQDNDSTFLTISDIGGFDLVLDSADNPSFTIDNLGSGAFVINDEIADATPFLINSSGNVGVGTANPDEFKLQVNGSIGPESSPTSTAVAQSGISVDTANNVGQYTSIKVGFNGFPVVSYYDVTNADLKLLICANRSCSSFSAITLDSTGDVGQYSSLGVMDNGRIMVSYYDATNGNLKYAQCDTSNCLGTLTTSTIDPSTNVVGLYTSLARSKDGFGVISYYDQTGGDLKIVKCNDQTCSVPILVTVETTGNVGQYSSIAIGRDGDPMVTYYVAAPSNDLRFVKCGSADCSTGNTFNNIETAGDTGHYSSLIVGLDGIPTIFYHDVTSSDLTAAKCVNTLCSGTSTITALDTTGLVGQYTSGVLGMDGFPSVVYYDATNGNLKTIKCGNESCSSSETTTVLESTDNIGQHTSLTIGAENMPIISYYDVTNGDLKVFACTTNDCSHSGTFYSGGSDIGSRSSFFNNIYAVTYWAKEGIQISNFDLAEEYKAIDESITAGDVVKIASEGGIIAIEKSGTGGQESIIGVISTKPGIKLTDWSLSESERSKMRPVALAGRVPVKITTENGPIKKGDYLVAASKRGYAMKACGEKFCNPGVTIGIALENFNPNQEGDTKNVKTELNNEKEEFQNEMNIVKTASLSVEPSKLEVIEDSANSLTKSLNSSETNVGEGRIMMFVKLGWFDGNAKSENSEATTKQTSNTEIDIEQLPLSGYSDSAKNALVLQAKTKDKSIYFSFEEAIFENNLKVLGNVDLKGELKLNDDSVGEGIIQAGSISCEIKFTKEKTKIPNVFVTIINEEPLIYSVSNKSKTGFTIKIKEPRSTNTTFDWLAL